MLKRDLRRTWITAVVEWLALLGIAALVLLFLPSGSQDVQEPEPTRTAVSIVQVIPTPPPPTATSRAITPATSIPQPPTSTPELPAATATPEVAQAALVVEGVPSPTVQALLPDGAPQEPTPAAADSGDPSLRSGEKEVPPTAQRPQPTAAKPASAQDPNILPNGVRYGERKPNLPNRIVRIASTAVKLDTSVYEVYIQKGKWEVADYAGGHHYNSRNPGEGGNIIVSGHNNWRGEVFRYLEFLNPGDEIAVWTLDGQQHIYRVEEIKKLQEKGASMEQRRKNAQVMAQTPHEQLTLITCWPYTTYTHRLIVIAKPVTSGQ